MTLCHELRSVIFIISYFNETKKDLKFDRMIYFLEKALIPPKIRLENILTCSAPQVVVVL